MYNRQRSPLYYGGQKHPPPQLSLHRRAALRTNSNGTQSAHKGKQKRIQHSPDTIPLKIPFLPSVCLDIDICWWCTPIYASYSLGGSPNSFYEILSKHTQCGKNSLRILKRTYLQSWNSQSTNTKIYRFRRQ
jgi:hypothetical protein